MFNIRKATLNDSVSINDLSLHLGYENTPHDTAYERLKCLLESTSDDVFVCEKSNSIVGWIHVFKAYRVASPTFYEIGGLVVCPKFRSIGVGRQLIDFVTKESKCQNLELRVRCNSIRNDTHAFYEKTGFTTSKTQQVFKMCI